MEKHQIIDINFQVQSKWKVDIALAFAFEGDTPDDACHYLQVPAPWIAISPAWRDFSGKKDERCLLYGPPAMDVSRAMIIGLGKALITAQEYQSKKEDKKNIDIIEPKNIIHTAKEKGEFACACTGSQNESTIPTCSCVESKPQYELFSNVRYAFAQALCACRDMGLEHIGIDLVSLGRMSAQFGYSKEEAAKELILASHLALYRYERFKEKSKEKSTKKNTDNKISKISFLLDDTYCSDALKNAVRYAEAEASGIFYARDLVNAPSNLATPTLFADNAELVANNYKEYNMSCHILKPKDMEKENMNSLLAVGQGSDEESRFVVLEYTPKNLSKSTKPIALVGKGVTFDSGGISLKPSAGMADMKADMSGAAAVLGTFEALGQLAKLGIYPSHKIVGLIPLVENMPSGKAIKPGDIVYSKKGKSIEILNTDAEGRLILIDALTYAQEKYDPEYLLDIATLTGACAIALGEGAAGIFSTKDYLAKQIQNKGEQFFERTWHLPLWNHLISGLKSNVADLANVGPREGGTLTAALFLKQFIDEDRAWVHIDMAAADNADTPVNPKGATGFGVRLLTDFAFSQF